VDNPFLITVYDRAFHRQGWVADYEQIAVTPRHNATGTASFSVKASHPRLPALMADGARVTIDYHGGQIMSGPLWASQGQLPSTPASTITFTVEDDLRLLGQVLGWPVPGAGIAAQSAAAYDVRSGPAETVLKAYVQANAVTRLGLPLTVAASAGRGPVVTAQARMDKLADLLLPLADTAGLGVRVRQSGAGLVLDCYTPAVRSRVLTEQSGVLGTGQWSRTGPSATDVVIGGQGEATARTFRLTRSVPLAAAWGTRVEVFRDANDISAAADLDARAAQTLAEGAPGAGIALQLAETDTFRYGRSLVVGDVVTVQVAAGLTVTDVVRSATLTHSADDGLTVLPQVGDESATAEPNALLARGLARVATAVRGIGTGR
jgi:hypothetical protein